jgi:thiamine kinase-like enzyme
LKQAFKRLGASLKEFHTVSTSSVSPLPESFLTAESQLIEDGLKLLNAEDKQWVEPLAQKLQQQLHSKSLPHSFVHGDPNMANFLLQKDKIAFIDFEVSGQYVNASRQGLATPAFDLITLLDYLDDLHRADIVNSFIEGYGGIPYDKETETYFRLVDTLNAVKWYHGVKSNLSPARIKQVQDTITNKLKRLKELSSTENLN